MSQITATATNTEAALAQLAKHGKTFNWARRLLGTQTGNAAAQLYAFCRHVDDIADGDKPGGEPLLARIAACLQESGPPPDDATAQFMALAAQHDISLAAAHSLLKGLLFDQDEVALQDDAALLVYAYRVAGTVGLMMAPVLRCADRRAHAHAIDLGIAMQLTNIARDVAEDAAMGRRYVPANWCGDVSADDILSSVHETELGRADMQAAISRLLDLADIYYASGFQGLAALPLRAHLSMAVAGYCYRQIGVVLRRRDCAYWRGRVVIGPLGKLIASLRSLRTLTTRLKPRPAHQPHLHTAILGELHEPGTG